MIKSVGPGLSTAVEAARLRESGQTRAPAKVSEATSETAQSVSTPAARMAAQGAPVDMERIAAVKQAIASGNYPVDPQKIAEKMLDLDLPAAKH